MRKWFILGLFLASLFLIQSVNATEVVRNPTANMVGAGGWLLPTNAYTSNNAYSMGSVGDRSHIWLNYTFESVIPNGAEIDLVYIGLEHYESGTGQGINVSISWDGGTNYSAEAEVSSLNVEVLDWINATKLTSWTRDKLNNDNLRVRAKYVGIGSSGGVINNTYFWTNNGTHYVLKNPEEINEKDKILCWNDYNLKFCELDRIAKHYGTWDLVDIYSGEFNYISAQNNYVYKKHITLTDNHPIYDALTDYPKKAIDFKIGDYLSHINGTNFTLIKITDIKKYKFTGYVYDVIPKTNNTYLFGKTFSDNELKILKNLNINWKNILDLSLMPYAVKVAWTAYLDWIPVNVSYTTPAPPPAVAKPFKLYDCVILRKFDYCYNMQNMSDYKIILKKGIDLQLEIFCFKENWCYDLVNKALIYLKRLI